MESWVLESAEAWPETAGEISSVKTKAMTRDIDCF
jgi:hypothetical protein